MVNREALEKIEILERKYLETWGRDVDHTVIPAGMTQEKMAEVLERIIDTGESILVGYQKIKNKRPERFSEKESQR